MKETREIRVVEDGTATYERRLTLPARGDAPARERVVETKRVDAAALEEAWALPILPPRCVTIRQGDRRAVVVTQDPPQVRTIQWALAEFAMEDFFARWRASGIHRLLGITHDEFERRLEEQREFRLAFPYLVKVFAFTDNVLEETFLFYRTAPITAETDVLCVANLPNSYPDYALCLSTDNREEIVGNGELSMAEAIANVEREFWGSAWNEHSTEEFLALAEEVPEVSSPWAWEHASAVDPLFVLRVPWRSTEWTLRDVLAKLLQGDADDSRADTFERFVRRIRAADSYDGVSRRVLAGIRSSSAADLVIPSGTLRIGDALEFDRGCFPECRDGGRFAVEWFSVPVHEQRYAKLVGLDAPVAITDSSSHDLRDGIAWHPQAASEDTRVTAGGMTIEPGVICRVTDEGAWPNLPDVFRISRVRRDVSGAIHVQYLSAEDEDEDEREYDLFTVIGTGAELFPGLQCFPKEEVGPDGFLTSGLFTLADGSVVRVGDRFWHREWESPRQISEHTVNGIQPRARDGETNAHGEDMYCRHAFASVGGQEVWFEGADGELADDLVRIPNEPIREVHVGGRRVACGARVRYRGAWRIVEAFTAPFSDGERFMRLEADGWVSLTKEDDLEFPRALRVGPRHVRCGDFVVRTGDLLLSTEDGNVRTAASFARDAADIVRVTCTDGNAITLFDRGALSEDWLPAVTSYERGDLAVARRMRIRLAEPMSGFPAGTRFTVWCIVLGAGTLPVVVTTSGFGFPITKDYLAACTYRRGRRWLRFSKESSAYPDARSSGTARTYFPPRVLPKGRCVGYGAVVGCDAHGSEIRVGDRVRVAALTQEMTDAARVLQRRDHVFTVVHSGVNHNGTWCYLDAGQDVGGRREHQCGSDTIPDALRNDSAWWARITWARAEECTVVTTPHRVRSEAAA